MSNNDAAAVPKAVGEETSAHLMITAVMPEVIVTVERLSVHRIAANKSAHNEE